MSTTLSAILPIDLTKPAMAYTMYRKSMVQINGRNAANEAYTVDIETEQKSEIKRSTFK